MDTETCSDDGDIPTPAPDDYNFTSTGGGMFAGSNHFTLAGGTFNNNTNNYVAAPALPLDFRMIPIGDIDLQQELAVTEKSGVVGRRGRHARNSVRRVYSAKMEGRNSNVTVAMYQGDGAEDDWRRDTEMYMSVRHPNIVQIFGGASYGNIHATVFHGDLVPFEQCLTPQSPIMMVYLYAYYAAEWGRVADYLASLWQEALSSLNCTMWIRCSTGRLSVDFVPPDIGFYLDSNASSVVTSLQQAATPSNVTEVIAIESLGLAQYHDTCSRYLRKYRDEFISTSATVHIGAATSWPSGHRYEEHVEIALPAEIDVDYGSWQILGHGEGVGALMGNGWTRYRADGVFDTNFMLRVSPYDPEHWFSQANHVFNRLQITSNLEDYVCIEVIDFILTVGNARGDPPPSYLFLCPKEDLRTGPTSFRWPNRPAYWSLDPEGIEVLSTEEVERLGFPSFRLSMNVGGSRWDASVYAGLRQFHQAKGFDPDSQDVARHLGHPLYKLCGDVNSPFAHVNDFNEAEETAEDTDTEDEWADAQSSLHEDYGDECSETEEGVDHVGKHSIYFEQQAPEVDQELMDGGHTGTTHETGLKQQNANDPRTGGGFIHRIFGALRHSPVVEVDSDNIDTDPISPFLV